jgi:uncharacterized membrane protein
MPATPQETATRLLHSSLEDLSERERRVVDRFLERKRVSRNANTDFTSSMTLGQRVADRVAAFGGSWPFIGIFGLVMVAWIVLNAVVLTRHGKGFDPYPFILLNLLLSMLAAIQAPVILMSQNRQAAKDRLVTNHDYEVNLKAELEILTLHEKLDTLREHQWNELIELQQQQLELLKDVAARLHRESPGSGSSGDEV